MITIALVLNGFSLVYALIYLATQLTDGGYHVKKMALVSGVFLFSSLAYLQWSHFQFLYDSTSSLENTLYLISLYTVAPCFYFYSKPFLKDDDRVTMIDGIHLLPYIGIFLLPFNWAFLSSFVVGAVYLMWLLKSLVALQAHRENFRLEFMILLVVLLVALFVIALGLSKSLMTETQFFAFYSGSIGLVFVALAIILLLKPRVVQQVRKAANATYQNSTLKQVDSAQKLIDLNTLMQEQMLYRQNNLDLHTVATELDLNSHQLSELVNSELNQSFSRYLREQRITAAKLLLITEPKKSILDIAMEVGFSSQSNFYDAFKEIVGITPSKFRKTQQ